MAKLYLGTRQVAPSVYTNAGVKYGLTANNFLGDVDANGVLQPPSGGEAVFHGVKDVSQDSFYYRFYNLDLTSVSFPDLESLSNDSSCSSAFTNNSRLQTVLLPKLSVVSGQSAASSMFGGAAVRSLDLSALTTVSGRSGCSYMFNSCHNLETVDLSGLTTVSGNSGCTSMFGYSGLTTINLSSLTTASGDNSLNGFFYSCQSLTTVTFPALTTVTGKTALMTMFRSCKRLVSVSFPALTTSSFGSTNADQFQNMFYSDTASTSGSCTVHFPSNMQTTISGLTGYPTFGGNANYITLAFDLPATS